MSNQPPVIRFERIGRKRDVPDLPITGDPADLDAVAEQAYRYAGRFLASSDYVVSVDEDGVVRIDGGRFGNGQVTRGTS